MLDAGEGVKILVIGGGGREHAICYGLQRSSACSAVFCAPGNPGIAAAGLVDDLQAAGIVAFGPSAKAAALEGSKDFMKRLCMKYNIPTAKYKSFTNAEDAKNYISETGAPIVVKADGLLLGKGGW
ncbi:hypothetical protein GOP47_0008474 [Adiantum capillus-veneris]|uniref:ATP-grasp domain-containing protein n=1 Tax=Adiantum capillus-veneris TaxID=13818 RepID=A0A9D4UYS1_ADICA|nr:hypothetical protein GOP47_0008474 [Adiantum capillus-veneris]